MNLLTEHTFGGLVKDTIAVYFQNFLPIFVIYTLPLFPVQAWYDYAVSVKALDQILPSLFLFLFVAILVVAPITVAVSDICLGNKPSVKRAYAVIFGGLLWRYLWTSVVFYLALMFSFVLMTVLMILLGKISPYIFIFGLVPALLFYALFMFTIQVALLEGSSGWAALARSKELGQGFYVRNFLAFIVVSVAIGAFSELLSVVIHEPIIVQALVRTFVLALFGPIVVILVIVIYYDMRVRKEAYDSTMLTQDLMR